MKILGIETSCDETAVSIVENGHNVLTNVVSSQIKKHALYGGVIPELAAREHLNNISTVIDSALLDARIGINDIDAVAVTKTPGLLPALLVGVSFAKGLVSSLNIPLIGINHITAHMFGALIDRESIINDPDSYPVVSLIVSGGHTLLVIIERDGNCTVIGRTLDDAAGEAFDKGAKILQLSYPGGPLIDKLSRFGNVSRFNFPRGLCGGSGNFVKPENRLNFSFSGVKTSLLYQLKEWDFGWSELGQSVRKVIVENTVPEGKNRNQSQNLMDYLDMIASYQEAVVDALVMKTMSAVKDRNVKTLIVCGGVACNSRLREKLKIEADETKVPLIIAKPEYCTDNAAMIAGLAYYQLVSGEKDDLDLDASPSIKRIEQIPLNI